MRSLVLLVVLLSLMLTGCATDAVARKQAMREQAMREQRGQKQEGWLAMWRAGKERQKAQDALNRQRAAEDPEWGREQRKRELQSAVGRVLLFPLYPYFAISMAMGADPM